MKTKTLDNTIDGEISKCITWQFDNATRLISSLMMLKDFHNQETADFFTDLKRNILNIETADEFGLSIIGIILNCERPVLTIDDEKVKYSLEKYRALLKARTVLLNTSSTLTALEQYIEDAFDGHFTVTDTNDGAIVYTATADATTEEVALANQFPDIAFLWPAGFRDNTVATAGAFAFDGIPGARGLDYGALMGTDNPIVTIVYYSGRERMTDIQVVEYGEDATVPSDYQRIGYDFAGWDGSFTNITENVTITAQYTIQTFTVTFAYYDGDTYTTSTQTVSYNGTAVLPANYNSRTGYHFSSWNGSYINVTSDRTITAIYEEAQYAVTFEYKDADGNTVTATRYTTYGGSIASSDVPNADEYEGYTFTSWDGSYTNVTEDRTLVAQYHVSPVVTFEYYVGTVLNTSTLTVKYGSDVSSAQIPNADQRTGYDFTSWSGVLTNVTENRTITAQYQIKTFTVTFQYYVETTLTTETRTVEYNNSVTNLPNGDQRTGYSFTAWNGNYQHVTQNETVVAQYNIEMMTVTFEYYVGSTLTSTDVAVEYGNSVPAASVPNADQRTHYSFTSWSGSYQNVTTNTTVTAQYELSEVQITFSYYDGTSSETSSQWVAIGGNATPPSNIERTGYIFYGWNSAYKNVTTTKTITARYASVNDYILFTPVSASTVTVGMTDSQSTNISKSVLYCNSNGVANSTSGATFSVTGSKVLVKCASTGFGARGTFTLSAPANCSGNLSAMCGGLTAYPHGCFYFMFYDCSNLKTAPTIDAATLDSSSLNGCFYNTGLSVPADLSSIISFGAFACQSMYGHCSNIKMSASQVSSPKMTFVINANATVDTTYGSFTNMFSSTSGTFTGTPVKGTTYYAY